MLHVRNLQTVLANRRPSIPIVDQVGFSIEAGRTVALVGESGCGKSITALSILRLLPPGVQVKAGEIHYRGRELTGLSEKQMRRVRGNHIAMIFQEPMTSLNPVLRVGDQVAEPLRVHRGLSLRAARRRAVQLLEQAGVPSPAARARCYPHQLSGGLRQRVMIAAALACEPDLLIADEPTTALDVTTQAHVLATLSDLQRQLGMALLLITHDLALVATIADRVCVMYAGRIVETAPTAALFQCTRHPYTQALLRSLPDLDHTADRRSPLPVIPGDVPRPDRRPGGCAFHPRCELGRDDPRCHEREPLLEPSEPGLSVACWKAGLPAPSSSEL
jgi:oligopeptide/dipeptide ABC transporter ATP-binding protein